MYGMQHKEPRGPRAVCDLLLEKLQAAEGEVVQLIQDSGQGSGRDALGHRSAVSLRCAPVHAFPLCVHCAKGGRTDRMFYFHILFHVYMFTSACFHTHVYVLMYDTLYVCIPCSYCLCV